jgi:glycosyl transferase, family 25
MKLFCINLDQSPKRLAYMQAQAALLGLDLIRIPAVDGARVPNWLANQFKDTSLLPGEIGCYSSHLTAAKTVVERSLPYAVVSEDDVPLAPDFARVVKAAIDAATPGWDFIHLTEYNLRTLVEVANLNAGYLLVQYTRFPKNSGAYVISNAGARKWLRPIARNRPCDVAVRYAWQFDFNVIGVYPPVALRSAGFVSDIDPTGSARRRSRQRKWAPSFLSRLYGAVWQTKQLGVWKMIIGQTINAIRAIHRHYTLEHGAPFILKDLPHENRQSPRGTWPKFAFMAAQSLKGLRHSYPSEMAVADRIRRLSHCHAHVELVHDENAKPTALNCD